MDESVNMHDDGSIRMCAYMYTKIEHLCISEYVNVSMHMSINFCFSEWNCAHAHGWEQLCVSEYEDVYTCEYVNMIVRLDVRFV